MLQPEPFDGFGTAHAAREANLLAIQLGDQVSSFIQNEPSTLQNLLPDFSTRQPSFCAILSCHSVGYTTDIATPAPRVFTLR
jgi:hypothetical protein